MALRGKTSSVKFTKSQGYTVVAMPSLMRRRCSNANLSCKVKDELRQAILEGDIETCKNILEDNFDNEEILVNKNYYFHPLLLAAKKGRFEIMKLLLDHRAIDINVCDPKQSSALHLAIQHEQRCDDCCNLLIGRGIDICLKDKFGNLAIHFAAAEGKFEIVQKLLEMDEKLNASNKNNALSNAKNKKNQTPLHMAASKGRDEVLQLLLDKGGRWDVKDSSGMLPLHSAAYYGHTKCCEILIEYDEDKQINAKNRDGCTPFILAAKKGQCNCCKILKNSKINVVDQNNNTAIHLAASAGFQKTVEFLIELKPNLDIRNKDGNTAMHKAAMQKSIGCLKILLDYYGKNDVNVEGETIKNPGVNLSKENLLHIAARNNCDESLCYLLSHSSFVEIINEQNAQGKTPLHLALNQCGVETSQILLEKAIDHTIQDNEGNIPLHIAAREGMFQLCKILVQGNRFKTINDRNLQGSTPLHLAALKGSADCCKILMVKGSDVNIADSDGFLPIHLAAIKGNVEVIRHFNKRGGSLINKPVENTGDTSLHLVAREGHPVCCEYILKTMKKNLIVQLNENGNTALDEAFIVKNDEVFELILMKWPVPERNEKYNAEEFYPFQAMIHEYMHKSLAENREIIQRAVVNSSWWYSGFSPDFCPGGRCENLRTLTRVQPQLAEALYDKCVFKNENKDTLYNFRIFEDTFYIEVPPDENLRCKSPFDPKTGRLLPDACEFSDAKTFELHALNEAIKCKNITLLQHPLTRAYLNYKSNTYMKFILLLIVFLEFMLVTFIGLYLCYTRNWQIIGSKFNESVELSCNSSVSDYETSVFEGQWTTTIAIFGVLILAWIIMFVTEVFFVVKMRHLPTFLSISTIVRIFRLIGILALIWPMHMCLIYIGVKENWQWQVGIWTLLISWFHMVHTLNEIPTLSVFMPVTIRFIWSFVKVLLYILLIIFIFALTFYILLSEKLAFSNLPQAFIKTVVWLLGDLAYDDMFLDGDSPIRYPVLTNIIFLLFVTSISGFIINLVITQPTDHLDEFKENALFHKLSSRILLFFKLDSIFTSIRKKYIVGFWVEKSDSHSFGKKISKILNVQKLHVIETNSEEKPSDVSILESILERLDEIDAKIAKTEFSDSRT